MKTLTTTLALICKDGQILLGLKKRGFATGKWNGFGGKVEVETLEENVKREAMEECGLKIKQMEKVGLIDFEFVGNPEVIQVHYFKILEWEGEPVETEEMVPKWYKYEEIPYDQMWADDKYWMPLFLAGKKWQGKCTFDEHNKILEKELEEVETL